MFDLFPVLLMQHFLGCVRNRVLTQYVLQSMRYLPGGSDLPKDRAFNQTMSQTYFQINVEVDLETQSQLVQSS